MTVTLAPVTRLALLGGGRMGEALVAGLLDAGWEGEPRGGRGRRRPPAGARGPVPDVRVVPSPAWAAAETDVLVVAVKPDDVEPTRSGRARSSLPTGALVLSIAAGVTLATLEAAVPEHAVVRAMPNTPALVRQGAAAIAPGRLATDAHLALAERVLGAVGIVVRVPEKLLDAVTGLSGSGPAYVFLVAETLIEAGVLVGLPRDIASRARASDAARFRRRCSATARETPEALRAAVTSPGGTTAAAGLQMLEEHGVRAAFLAAVEAATDRSRELGRAGD